MARGVVLNYWYATSIEVVVATVSTVVYQYKNTALTTYTTVQAENAYTNGQSFYYSDSIEGLPKTFMGQGDSVYGGAILQSIVLAFGGVITDPYGTTYTSPTPVLSIAEATWVDVTPTIGFDGVLETCSPPYPGQYGDTVEPYPSGKHEAITFQFSANGSGQGFGQMISVTWNLARMTLEKSSHQFPASSSTGSLRTPILLKTRNGQQLQLAYRVSATGYQLPMFQ
jgi:hypothetical protein